MNIVEEMSIASGVPMPRLFVLEQEPGINAFAAGYSPADAAITVTAGALDTLNRDELQGVIGHEFSHILNGDMRLNIRLIGLLAGILLLGLVGLRCPAVRAAAVAATTTARTRSCAIALALLVLGFVGQFFAGLIKAAVSAGSASGSPTHPRCSSPGRPPGLVGALKKIAGLPDGLAAARHAHGERQVNHMLFGEGARACSQLLRHAPAAARADRGARAELRRRRRAAAAGPVRAAASPNGLAEDAARGLVGAGPAAQPSTATVVQVEPSAMPRPGRHHDAAGPRGRRRASAR